MMKKTAVIAFFGCAMLLLFACSKNSGRAAGAIRSVSPDTGHFGTVVTIRGENFDSINGYVTIDGVTAPITRISDTTITLTVPTTHTGIILVKSTTGGSTTGPTFTYVDDILVAGALSSDGYYYYPCYWDNSIPVELSTGPAFNAYATGITSSGDDIYVCGYVYFGNNNRYAMAWKDGTAQFLTNTTTGDAQANAIQVSGQNVYVAGYLENGGYDVATVWVNGQPTALMGDTVNSYASAITISGTDVYVAGYKNSTSSNSSDRIALYWKNGTATTLSDGTVDAVTTGIAIIGSDVYVSGNMGAGELWVDGVGQSLSTSTTGLCSSGKDLYLSGTSYSCNPDWFNYAGGPTVNAITADSTGAYTAGYSVSNNVVVPSYTIWSSPGGTVLLNVQSPGETGNAWAIGLRH